MPRGRAKPQGEAGELAEWLLARYPEGILTDLVGGSGQGDLTSLLPFTGLLRLSQC